MSIYLVVPPQYSPISPTLAVPTLVAYLRSKGHSATGIDLNIDAFHYILSGENLAYAKQFIGEEYEKLSSKNVLEPDELDFYKTVVNQKAICSEIEDNVDIAMEIVMNKEKFKNYEKYTWAMDILQKALVFGTAPYYPTSMWMFGASYEQSMLSMEGIITAAGQKNAFLNAFYKNFIDKVIKNKPTTIAISVSVQNQIIPAMILAGMLKEVDSNLKVLLGGSFTTENSETLKSDLRFFDYFDGICVNEGELTLEKYMDFNQGDCDIAEVPNLIYLQNERVVQNKLQLIEDMNILPAPDFSDFDLDKYFSPERMLPLQTSRGCYWRKCAFCFHFYSYGKSHREKKSNKVLDEMNIMNEKYGVENFYFVDEAVSTRLFKDLSSLINQSDLTYYWGSAARLEKGMDADLCQAMYKAGCRRLEFGVESGSQRILDLMDKGTKIPVIKDVLKNCYEAGISIQTYILIGFPTEVDKDLDQTIDLVDYMTNYVDTVGYMNFDLGIYSKLAREKEKYGIKKVYENPKNQELVISYSKFDLEEGFTQEEAINIVDYLYARGPGTDQGQGQSFYTLPEWHNFFYMKFHKVSAMRQIQNLVSVTEKTLELPELTALSNNAVKSSFDLSEVDSIIRVSSEKAKRFEIERGCSISEAIEEILANTQGVTRNEKWYFFSSRSSKLIELPNIIIEAYNHCSKTGEVIEFVTARTNYSEQGVEDYLYQLYELGGIS